MRKKLQTAWWIFVEAFRFGWSCRQKQRGFPWSVLPIPPQEFVKFRLDYAYGAYRKRPPKLVILRDVCRFLLWSRNMRALRESSRLRIK